MGTKTYERILGAVDALEIVDTHEHLPEREDARSRSTDVFREYLTHYFDKDLLSSGMPVPDLMSLYDGTRSVAERWRTAEPWWELCRHTGYGQVLDKSVEGLYGLPGIHAATIEEIDERVRRSLDERHFDYVLKEKSRIRTSLLNRAEVMRSDPRYFTRVASFDHLVAFDRMSVLVDLENATGIRVTGFDAFLDACEASVVKALTPDVVAVKIGLAYRRTLRFDRVPRAEAQAEFDAALKRDYGIDRRMRAFPVSSRFEDFMMHFLLGILDRKGMALQIHTGLHEGNGNLMRNSHPEHLNPLFLEYPDIRFDLFHIGYPYQHVLSGFAKNFPHVFIDMCWAHAISPVASRAALSEWLEAVPCSKISAFGGDYIFVDGVYGHQRIARDNVARVLADKIDAGVMDHAQAEHVAKALFHDNPKRLFGLRDL